MRPQFFPFPLMHWYIYVCWLVKRKFTLGSFPYRDGYFISDDMEIANSMTNGGWGDPLFGPQIHERESFNKWKYIKTKLGQGTRKT